MMGIQKMRYYMALLIFMNKFPSRYKKWGAKNASMEYKR